MAEIINTVPHCREPGKVKAKVPACLARAETPHCAVFSPCPHREEDAAVPSRRNSNRSMGLQGNTFCHPKIFLWDVDYFELKTIRAQDSRGKFDL